MHNLYHGVSMSKLRSVDNSSGDHSSHVHGAIPRLRRGDVNYALQSLNSSTDKQARYSSDLQGTVIVLDTETTGLDPYRGARMFCVAYATDKGEFGFRLKTPETIEFIQSILMDPTKKVVFHNGKFDLKMFWFEGIDIFSARAELHDTLILAKMFNGMMTQYDLKFLASYFCNRPTDDKDEIVDWLKAHRREIVEREGREPGFQDAPLPVVRRRAIWDVKSTLMLFAYLYPRVQKICPALYLTERQLMLVVVDMENTGVEIDISKARELDAKAADGIRKLKEMLNELVLPITVMKKKKETLIPKLIDRNFNPGSTTLQMPAAFEKLGMTLMYKTSPKKGKKGGKPRGGGRWSFNEYSMIQYSPQPIATIIKDSGEDGWPLPRFLKALRDAAATHNLPQKYLLPPLALKLGELKKMRRTYYHHLIEDCLDVHTRPDGREVGTLHCNFNQSEAMSGRFSSSSTDMS